MQARAFVASQVLEIAGVSFRQLDSWVHLGLVTSSIKASGGSGEDRLFGFADVFAVAVIARLRALGVATLVAGSAATRLSTLTVTEDSDLAHTCLAIYGAEDVVVLPTAELHQLPREGKAHLALVVFLGSIHDDVLGATTEWVMFRQRPRRGRKPGSATSSKAKQRGTARIEETRAKPNSTSKVRRVKN